jgi:hypothetical protein
MTTSPTHDDIRDALTVLGYENPVYAYVGSAVECDEGSWVNLVSGGRSFYGCIDNGFASWGTREGDPIPLDLASLLRRCRERDLSPSIVTTVTNEAKAEVYAGSRPFIARHADDLTALILALAAMGQKENA